MPDDVVIKIPVDEVQQLRLKENMLRLAGDSELRRRLGSAARTYIAEHHDWVKVAQQYADFIHQVEDEHLGDAMPLRKFAAGLLASNDSLGIEQFIAAAARHQSIGLVL